MAKFLQILFFIFIVRPGVLLLMGLNVRNRKYLPKKGPAILAANHNSHLDTAVLMSLFPLLKLRQVRPVGAADYFHVNAFLKWFSATIFNIIPIQRRKEDRTTDDPLATSVAALNDGDILIFFPEGSRGEPEKLSEFKTGLARLAQRCPDAQIIPIFMRGLGKALPKGDFLLVPFVCDVYIGKAITWQGDQNAFMQTYIEQMTALAALDKRQHTPSDEA